MLDGLELISVEVVHCGGVGAVIGSVIGAVTGLFGGGRKESSAPMQALPAPTPAPAPAAPAAPTPPDTSAADAKAKADEERRRRIAAQQNATSVNGGQGSTEQAATSTPKLG